ncbi:permease for cytosine/purines, uracil, thiamine, allantoin-domain-containing protein [Suillus fuscotomentosus]|uniref:Permease for cytosine/purines, uracil, thiamine, allantoin-domain-containing protein n=1 Tax=Suillus fuscotomentosus TaxID=1912939 RepID=A0AAD4E2Q7_9AGAM|nr:permease for cytosine/purines, uracil, thiamine, allantoin-domain-containing protein [Suillus fuscotomentosus]KAG1898460.1 permease for cytosine/purines, uracil, thiamine, allantoin-domain-containing protein [Suillus fuscotomentosus]
MSNSKDADPHPSRWRRFLQYIEVPTDPGVPNTPWLNRDLIPMPKERRTYKIWSYFIFWCIGGLSISAYTAGSTLLAYGLDARQAIVSLVICGLIVGLLSVTCGWMGERFYCGVQVLLGHAASMQQLTAAHYADSSSRGAYFPVIVRAFVAIFWDGLQAYWGGQAVAVTIGAIIPGFAHMKQTLAGGILLKKDFIGMIIYYVFFIAIMRIPPERLQKPFIVSSVMFSATLIGLLVWAVSNTHSGGPLFQEKASPVHGGTGWAMLFGITAILGAWSGGTIGQSDWTRYANRPYAPTLAQLIVAPFCIIVCATIGIIVTSCAQEIVGSLIWEPFLLLAALQNYYNDSPRVRAAIFFAGLSCVCAQLGMSIVLNSVSVGMDISGVVPRYINIRRGAYLLAFLGLASNPWQYLSNASIFLTVLSSFGIFFASFSGILLADYFVVRGCMIKLEDCYIGDKRSIYWYHNGVNWRAPLAWVLGVFPTMPGLIMTTRDATAWNVWVRIFHIAFFVGLLISFVAFSVICCISSPGNVGIGALYHEENSFEVEDELETEEKEKGPV